MKKNDDTIWELIGKFFTGLLLIILGTMWRGFVLKIIWLWFIVPVFAIREISIVESLGLSLTLNFLIGAASEKEDEDPDYVHVGKIAMSVIPKPAVALILAFIIHQFFQ